MNKQDLIQKLKTLDGLSADEKSALINLVNTKKKYGLVWEDKIEDVEEELREKLPVLREVVEKRILAPSPSEKAGDEAPNHILIEGDNLHALTALTFTHEDKIDVIYIDPPYNTGNKDFKYNDSFVDREDSFKHSKWLSFMHKRLEIAKRLLSDKGVIFISIDDNEQAQLKLLCDEIFGEINAIGPIIQNKQNAKNDTANVQKNHEYIVMYRKRLSTNENNKVIPSLKNLVYKTREVFEESGTFYFLNDAITTRGEGGILNARSNLGHTIYYNNISKDIIAVCDYDLELAKTSNVLESVYFEDKALISKGYVGIRPPKVRGKLGCWTWSLEKINNEKSNLVITGNKGNYAVKKRTFISKSDLVIKDNRMWYNSYSESNSRSIIDYSTNNGTETLNEVLGVSGKFNNPKNLEMLNYLIKLFPNNCVNILDFFAGSGTTLHATMQLNAEDGGNRQCILVTNNENNICEEVTYERNKRVINGYTNSKGVEVEGLKNNNLRYYKSEYVSRETSLKNKKQLTLLATELLSIKEDCYNDITNEFSKAKWLKLFNGTNSKLVCVIYDDIEIEAGIEIIQQVIAKYNPTQKIKVYVFSNGQYPYTEDFEDILDKIELCALPDAIYKAYQNVLPKRKRNEVPEIEDPTAEDVETATLEEDLFNQNSQN